MKRLVLLGASGSIGEQTIDIILQHPDLFTLVSFGVGKNIDKAKMYIEKFPHIQTFSVERKEDAEILRKQYPTKHVLYGSAGMEEIVTQDNYDVFVNALVGFAGFIPTLRAIETKHDVALANKETLVCGGALINKALKQYGCALYPIDSEHSAIWQCLQGNQKSQVKRLWITCSGGAFRNKTREEMEHVSVKDALAHPNWSMGAKITIDSATLMNKGFEVIEAHWLFDIPYENIQVVLHPQSVVHSAVEYVDHSIIAQLGAPDMRLPIQYALTYPDRYTYQLDTPLDLTKLSTLQFDVPDTTRFPLLELAFTAGKKGGNLCAVMNGANEVANAAFRNGKIPFLKIEEIVKGAVNSVPFQEFETIEDVIQADTWGREYGERMIQGDNA